jgi:purine-nucleoside phosphorylase
MSPYDRAAEAADWLARQLPVRPLLGITLGTGGGREVPFLHEHLRIPYAQIPHFAATGVESHAGELIAGMIGEVPVICLAGRYHYYEGWPMAHIVHPVRTLRLLGCTGILLTNAAGGIHPEQQPGDLVLIRDHINLIPDNPLRGLNDDRLGPRFPDMLDAYDPVWRTLARQAASKMGLDLTEGVYVGLAGPNLETGAEYTFLHRIGGDLVGMSTVPEVIAARHCGLNVAAVSVVSNVCYPPERMQPTSLESVIATVTSARDRLYTLLENWIPLIGNT